MWRNTSKIICTNMHTRVVYVPLISDLVISALSGLWKYTNGRNSVHVVDDVLVHCCLAGDEYWKCVHFVVDHLVPVHNCAWCWPAYGKRVEQEGLNPVLSCMLRRLEELNKLRKVRVSTWKPGVEPVMPSFHHVRCSGTSVPKLAPNLLDKIVRQPKHSEVRDKLVNAGSVQRWQVRFRR